jgi:hypothetical protein
MDSPLERRLDAHLARIINQIRQIRQLDMTDEAAREKALAESLEALRSLTMYRGLLKNVSEQHFAASHDAFHRTLDAANPADPADEA